MKQLLDFPNFLTIFRILNKTISYNKRENSSKANEKHRYNASGFYCLN